VGRAHPDEKLNFDTFAKVEDCTHAAAHTRRENGSFCTPLSRENENIPTCIEKIDGEPMFYAIASFKKAVEGI
jgi:hypothetical protein